MLPSKNITPTISHIQLAEMTGKRQDNVKRTILNLANNSIIGFPQIENVEYINNLGLNAKKEVFFVNERDSYIIVAQLCPEYTAKLVDYWMETKNNQPKLPQTFAEALQLAADQAKQLELAAPKIEFHDTVVQSKNTYKYQEAGKKIQQRPNKFIAWLREEKYIDKHNMPYQRYIDQGLFKASSGVDKSGFSFTQGRVTEKGLSYFTNKLSGKIL